MRFDRAMDRQRTARSRVASACLGLVLATSACSGDDVASTSTVDSTVETTVDATVDSAVDSPVDSAVDTTVDDTTVDTTVVGTEGGFFDTATVHTLDVSFDQVAYDAMIATFEQTGDKEWIEAAVVIDGIAYDQVGLRLKGNSSLAGLGGDSPGGGGGRGPMSDASADEPESLPWLVRLDEFVDDQDHDGVSEFVVRSNNSETALNEAVSVGLLAEAGLLTQRATYVRFTVNDRPVALRLVLENMEQEWADANLPDDALLYKADASGDYSYRGDDPTAYEEAWDQEAGDDDLEPLIDLLDFVNNSDDATFAAEIGDHLDLDAFAEYMAMEDLLQNFDDISGPGNNSFLAFDPATEQFTVVAWDHNLALAGVGPGGQGRPGGQGGQGGPPAGGTLPEGFDPSQVPPGGGGAGGGGPTKANPLVDRLAGLDDYTTRYDAATARLTSELIESGTAASLVDSWTSLLVDQAADLVGVDTIADESAAVAEMLGVD